MDVSRVFLIKFWSYRSRFFERYLSISLFNQSVVFVFKRVVLLANWCWRSNLMAKRNLGHMLWQEKCDLGDLSLRIKHQLINDFVVVVVVVVVVVAADFGLFLLLSQESICPSPSHFFEWMFVVSIFSTPIWGRFPIWLAFFRWVESTNYIITQLVVYIAYIPGIHCFPAGSIIPTTH